MSRPMRQARLPLSAGDAYKMARRPPRPATSARPAGAPLAEEVSAAGQCAEGPRVPVTGPRAFLDSGLPAEALHLHRQTAAWTTPVSGPQASLPRIAARAGALIVVLAALALWAGGRI